MKITKLRHKHDGLKFTSLELEQLSSNLYNALTSKGFITETEVLTSSSIKVGMHMCSFRIDPIKRGYNADTGHFGRRCKAGYKKTAIPTWDERVEFNNTVNEVLNEFEANANIKSGEFEIRSFNHGPVTKWYPYNYANSDRFFYEITKEKEMLEEYNERIKQKSLQLFQGGAA